MADYKVEVDLSELFDDMTINEQKNFLVDKFCSLPIDKMVEVVGEMLENLNGDQTAKVIEDAFDNLHEQAQEHVINYVKGKVMMFGKMITRRCLLTLSGGAKIQAVLTMPKPTKPIFPKEMERQFIKSFNESQPDMVHKVIKCHIMRN